MTWLIFLLALIGSICGLWMVLWEIRNKKRETVISHGALVWFASLGIVIFVCNVGVVVLSHLGEREAQVKIQKSREEEQKRWNQSRIFYLQQVNTVSLFEEFDRNKDEKISSEEYMDRDHNGTVSAYERERQALYIGDMRVMDQNHDGVLSVEEFCLKNRS